MVSFCPRVAGLTEGGNSGSFRFMNTGRSCAIFSALTCLSGFLGLGNGSFLVAASGDNMLGAWLQTQTNLHTWTAEVTQTRSLKTLSQPLKTVGRVWFAAPDRFRWEIGRPPTTIAVRQPEQLLVIYPNLKRVERYRWETNRTNPWKEGLALLEAGFPRDQAELERRFQLLDQRVKDDRGILLFQPKSPGARRMIPRITIEISLEDAALRATELQFADGSHLRNEFSHEERNVALPDHLFTPHLNPEFEVVDPWKAISERKSSP